MFPAQIGDAERNTNGAGDIGAHYYWRITSKMILIDAPRLLTCQLPNNLSLHGGNENSMKRLDQGHLHPH
jgi:hypothetical protein